MTGRSHRLAAALDSQRSAFKAFLTARVGSEAEAEDILQNGLLKALRQAGDLQDESKLVAWFYQLLRNALVDHFRRRGAARRRDDLLGETTAALGENVAAAWQPHLCDCLGGVIATLKPPHAELLRRVDLEGESVQIVARDLKLTPNHASVTLHRARKELRTRLENFCGDCAAGACLDCDCAERGKSV